VLKKKFEPFIVTYAKYNRVKLKDQNGDFHNDISIEDAKDIANAADIDLVCFAEPTGKDLAFCKIMDYGKWKFELSKNHKKGNKSRTVTKEIRFSPVISDHDVGHKVKKAKRFLENGDELLFFMQLKGRQRMFFKEAEARMNEIILLCTNGKEVSRKKTGNNIAVRLTKKGVKDE
jgi:translation initiation factor IF-3